MRARSGGVSKRSVGAMMVQGINHDVEVVVSVVFSVVFAFAFDNIAFAFAFESFCFSCNNNGCVTASDSDSSSAIGGVSSTMYSMGLLLSQFLEEHINLMNTCLVTAVEEDTSSSRSRRLK